MSQFDGSRVYNGCPDSTMQRRLDAEEKAAEQLKKQIHEITGEKISAPYFPAPPSGYIAFSGHKLIDNPDIPHQSRIVALNAALEHLRISNPHIA